jgi:DNA-binding transcriptional ArsR family regulator
MKRNAMSADPTVVFKTLGDPTQCAIFERLSRDGELTAHALTAPSGVSQPAVTKHLSALKLAGLVRDRRHRRETLYRAEPTGLAPLIGGMSVFANFWHDRFNRLEDFLKRTKRSGALSRKHRDRGMADEERL